KFPGARFISQENAQTTPITEILVNSMVTSHAGGERIPRGRKLQIRGWAWDGGSGIAKVAASFDQGEHWQEAQLGQDLGRFSWRSFELPVDTARIGKLGIMIRATSRDGAQQPAALTPNPSGYYHNMMQTLELEIV